MIEEPVIAVQAHQRPVDPDFPGNERLVDYTAVVTRDGATWESRIGWRSEENARWYAQEVIEHGNLARHYDDVVVPWPMPIEQFFATPVEAYVYGSVAKGTATDESDLDVFVFGAYAEALADEYYFERPPVIYKGVTRPLHLIGPTITKGGVTRDLFLRAQPEAIRL